jgi:hypothetical protein
VRKKVMRGIIGGEYNRGCGGKKERGKRGSKGKEHRGYLDINTI